MFKYFNCIKDINRGITDAKMACRVAVGNDLGNELLWWRCDGRDIPKGCYYIVICECTTHRRENIYIYILNLNEVIMGMASEKESEIWGHI